jgi:uncharacterized membrane protein
MSLAPTNPLVRAGLVLGAGFMGLADGIVLHQILGWHHLVCVTATCTPDTVAQLKRQNTQDGLFHLALWLVLLAGTGMLFRASRLAGWASSGRGLLGAMLVGAGLFNVIEGVVDHHVLAIHHVLPGSPHQMFYDLLWLELGTMLTLFGVGFMQSRKI